MGWNAEEKASYFLNALEDMKAMLTDFDNAEDWGHGALRGCQVIITGLKFPTNIGRSSNKRNLKKT